VYFHGTASSRLEVRLLTEFAHIAQLQIICIDRPGYGLSTFVPRKNLCDFAGDVNFVVDHFGIKQFGVIGWSGGGAFALTYAALFPERIARAVVVGTPALPFDIATAHNFPFARFIMKLPFLAKLTLKNMQAQVLKANGNVNAFLASRQGRRMLKGWPDEDAKFFSNSDWAVLMYGSMAEAFRQGNRGVETVVLEHQLFMKPWPVSLLLIPTGKLFIWQGAKDKTCRVDNAYRIARGVSGAHLEIFEGKGHCVMFDNTEKLVEIFRSG
jgi:pimeloyl-ACP methyl ester carboxylesterase